MAEHRWIGPDDADPYFSILTRENSPGSHFALWKVGHSDEVDGEELVLTRITNLTTNRYLADQELSPDKGWIVYNEVRGDLSPKQSQIKVVDWDDTVISTVYADVGNHDAFGNVMPLQPTWKPDGTKILFRSASGANVLDSIKEMNPDGTGVVTLYTAAAGARVEQPTYNHDGTKIAWMETLRPIAWAELKTADDDGTNVQTAYAAGASPNWVGSFAWARTQNKLAFITGVDSTFTSTRTWRTADFDGSNAVVVHTINQATYGPGDANAGLSKRAWLPDDSAFITTLLDNPAGNDHVVHSFDPAGGGVTPLAGGTLILPSPSSDFWPEVFENDEETWRIYLPALVSEGGLNQTIHSVDLTGAALEQEFEGGGPPPGAAGVVNYHGFRFDTLN